MPYAYGPEWYEINLRQKEAMTPDTAPTPQEPSSISGGGQALIPVVATEAIRAAIIREFDRQEECWRYDADAMLAVIVAAAKGVPSHG